MNLLNYEKDTNADWEEIAQNNPYWGVLTHDDRFLGKDLSSDVLDEFFKSGIRDIADIVSALDSFDDRRLETVLDFGSGVGRLVIPMAAYAVKAVGIEISKSMIAELNKNLKRQNIENVEVYMTCEDLFKKNPEISFDWINSQIVFQHIPPEIGYKILEKLLKALKIGGYFSLHFNIFKTLSSFSSGGVFQQTDSRTVSALYIENNESLGTIQMYDYDLNRILYLLLKHGISDFRCVLSSHGEHYTACILGQRTDYTILYSNVNHLFVKNASLWSKVIVNIIGFSNAESWGTWTDSKEATIAFYMLPELCGKELKMKIVMRAFLDRKGEQSVKLFVNNVKAAVIMIDNSLDNEYIISIPPDVIKDDKYLTIRLEVENPTSPNTIGVSEDTRKLGVGIVDMEIKPV